MERAKRNASKQLAESADRVLNANGSLQALWPKGRRTRHRWFEDYVELEAKAQSIHIFQCQIVPGLLQTYDYARALLGAAWPPHDEAETTTLLDDRMKRQDLFERVPTPMVSVIVDEAALRRGADLNVMSGQLAHLVEMASRPYIELQVLPFTSGLHAGTEGSFIVLEMTQTESVVYVEPPAHGQVIPDQTIVTSCIRRFGSLRTRALPPGESIAFIKSLQGGHDHGYS